MAGSSEPTMPVATEYEVNRWRRFGMDRLYVNLPDDTKVGWWDLLTDEAHPEADTDAEALVAAVRRWRAGAEPTPPASAPEPVAEPEPVPEPPTVEEAAPIEPVAPERPWLDLSANVAGAAVREQALAATAAAPVRTLVARALRVHTDERAWRIGAVGEEKVAAQLDKVVKKDPRWRFIHAIPVGTRGSDIDHLVMGPGGVFTANAKNHPDAKIWVGGDTFMVNGNRQPYVRNARHEAARAAKLLSEACGFPVFVEGLIVPVNANEVTVKSQPRDVYVVPRRQIARWLLNHGDVLSLEQCNAVFEAARKSTTWR